MNRRRYLTRPEEVAEPEIAAGEEARGEEPIVEYARGVVGLIEGRPVGREEFADLLGKISRQHRLWRRRRVDYVVEQLNKDPP